MVLLWTITKIVQTIFILVCSVYILNIPVNIFSTMSGLVFLGWTSTKQRIKCLPLGQNAVSPTTKKKKRFIINVKLIFEFYYMFY